MNSDTFREQDPSAAGLVSRSALDGCPNPDSPRIDKIILVVLEEWPTIRVFIPSKPSQVLEDRT